MPSQSEASYGARLRHAQQILSFIQTYPTYAPPRQEESIANFAAFLQNITDTNTAETVYKQNYNTAVAARYALCKIADNSISKSLVPIRAVVLSQYGKNSVEFKQINTIVAKMRKGNILHTVAADKITPVKISQSQQSYGSQSKLFSDIIATLSTLPNYNPSNPALQIVELQTVLDQTLTLSDSVSLNYARYIQTNSSRAQLYAELSDRIQRIKNYVKAQYGLDSVEYRFIRNLSA